VEQLSFTFDSPQLVLLHIVV
jgi:hypothetical protein